MYCWQIYSRSHKRSHVVDAADGDRSNWMRYVNCARNWREQNLIAYQYQGQLYYRTIKIIPRFTEPLVFYGSEFASALHIDLGKYNAPPGYAQKFGAPAAKKPKLDLQKTKAAKSLSPKHKNNGQAHSKNDEKNKKIISISKTEKAISSKTVIQSRHKVANNPICNKENIVETKIKVNTALQSDNVNKEEFNCKICKYKGINSSDIDRHSLRQKNVCVKDRSYKCDICQSSFSEKHHLINHIRIHTGEKPYKCDICQSSFSSKNVLNNHIRTHTGEKPYKCDMCRSSFSYRNVLNNHIRTHTGEKPYKCDICQSSFSIKGSLNNHIRTHTGEKPYKCDKCQSSFSIKGSLFRHIRTHTGEKPFKCDICQSSFSQKCNLNLHIRTHTGEKPYKCNLCHRSFIQKGDLNTHIRTHTGEKPHKCDICQSSYTDRRSLKSHVNKHHS